MVDLFLDARGRPWRQELTGGIQQQHRGGVDRHQLADLVEQLVEQPVHAQLGQPGVGDDLKPPQPLSRGVRGVDLRRHDPTLDPVGERTRLSIPDIAAADHVGTTIGDLRPGWEPPARQVVIAPEPCAAGPSRFR